MEEKRERGEPPAAEFVLIKSDQQELNAAECAAVQAFFSSKVLVHIWLRGRQRLWFSTTIIFV